MSKNINLGKDGKENLKKFLKEKNTNIQIVSKKLEDLFNDNPKTARRRLYRWTTTEKESKDLIVREDLLRKTLRAIGCDHLEDYKYLPDDTEISGPKYRDNLIGTWYAYALSIYLENVSIVRDIIEIYSKDMEKVDSKLDCFMSYSAISFRWNEENTPEDLDEMRWEGSGSYNGTVLRFLGNLCFDLTSNGERGNIPDKLNIIAQDPHYYDDIPVLIGISSAINLDKLTRSRIWFAIKDYEPKPTEAFNFLTRNIVKDFSYESKIGLLQKNEDNLTKYHRDNIGEFFSCFGEE